MTVGGMGGGGVDADERRIQRWLAMLRDGSEGDKVSARRGLAATFEQRGMLPEAIELLERNIDAGVRGAETLRWLSRLYQAQDDEVRSLEAAVRASQQVTPASSSELPPAAEASAPPFRSRAIRHLMIGLVILAGLGITVEASHRLVMPYLRP
jgi:hypothetical protein